MDIKELRSQLCHVIHELSPTLTDTDLIELKWATVKRIFALLIEQYEGSELWNQRNALAVLLQDRNSVLSARRNGTARNHTKEQRSDEDSAFRTQFFVVVFDALTILRWPPAMEAFNGGIALLSDNSTIISAITHLLQKGWRQQKEAQIQSATVLGTPTSEKRIPADESRSSERKRIIRIVDNAASVPCAPELTSLEKVRDEVAAFSPTADWSSHSNVKPPGDSLRHTLHIVQHQNEVLSKSLKQVQEAVCVRENAESRMSVILGELKSTVDEIVGLGTGKRTAYRQSNSRTGAVPDGVVKDDNDRILTDDLEFEFRREVEREEKDERDRRGDREAARVGLTISAPSRSSLTKKAAIGTMHGVDNNSVAPSSSSGSSILWTKVHGRIDALQQQWEEARGDARRAVVQVAEVLPPLDIGNEYSYAKNRSPGGDEHTSSGSRRSSYSAVNGMSQSCRLRLHQIFGVQLSLSITRAGDDGESSVHHALDLPRIHQLQRDLVDFSDAAFTLCSESSRSTMTEETPKTKRPLFSASMNVNVDPLPADGATHLTQAALQRLHDKAQDLLLHLSCLAPLAPLTAPAPWTSSMTGIEVLEREVAQATEKLGGKRSPAAVETILRMQAACDRVRSEQVALMRCLQASQRMLRQWPEAVRRLTPLMDTLGKSVRDTLSRAGGEVHDLSNAANAVTDALKAAELIRSEGERSPLDGLARGKMGAEVANLISSLRLHSHEIGSTAQCLDELRRQVSRDIDKEMSAFGRAKKSLLAAAESTTSYAGSMEESLLTATRQQEEGRGHTKPKRHQRPPSFQSKVPGKNVSAEFNPEWTF